MPRLGPVSSRSIADPTELLRALEDGVGEIHVEGTVQGMPSIRLAPGTRLLGGKLVFSARGVVLSCDNSLEDLVVECPSGEVAIGNDTGVSDLGVLSLGNVETQGQVLLLADRSVRQGHVQIEGLNVRTADLRGREIRPHGYEVDVLQGALTIWNRQDDPDVVVTAEARGVSVGWTDAPVRGSGVLIGGHSDGSGGASGGTITMTVLETGAVFTDGGITPGTPDLISGGVFVQAGTVVSRVRNEGPVTTHGANDMALDNWGRVEEWTCAGPVTTTGPSGIGFVNFGDLSHLDVQGPLETFGAGARGFNLYGGSLERARFASIATRGDGAVGIQVTKPLRLLEVQHDLTTSGGRGTSLVKGHQVPLEAVALSVKPGGHIGLVRVGGDIRTSGDQVTSLELLGSVDQLEVDGGIVADGQGSVAVQVISELSDVLGGSRLSAPSGQESVLVEPPP
jgi:hypothetical protein